MNTSTEDKNQPAVRTFGFLKPETEPGNHAAILKALREAGFVNIRQKEGELTAEQLREHCSHVTHRDFYPGMEEYLLSGPVIFFTAERHDGVDAIQALRDLCGPTDPKKGSPGQIRFAYGVHDPEVIYKNAIHASDSAQAVTEETERFLSGAFEPD